MARIAPIAAALAAACLTLAGTAGAQYGFGRGTGTGPFGGMGPWGMGSGGMGGQMMGPAYGLPTAVTVVQAGLAALRADLAIGPAQEAAWQSFAQAITDQAQQMQQLHDQMFAQTAATAPERLTLLARGMQAQAQSATRVAEAMTALYAVLTPQQRAILDQGSTWCRYPGPFGC